MSNQSRSSEPVVALPVGPVTRRSLALRGLGALLLAGAVIVMPATDVAAQSRVLDAPRAAGLVGERFDGYAAVRGQASNEIAALVAQVNAERRAVYAQRAAADKVSIEAIGRIYAQEILNLAPPKTWFLSESGQWTQK